MRKISLVTVLVAFALAIASAPAAAQETGTPVFKSPYRTFNTSEVGVAFSDGEGYNWALEGFYGYGRGPWDIGLRAGFADATNGIFLVGVDARTRVLNSTESFPLDGALTLGIGGQFADGGSALLIPIGLSLGRRILLEGSETTFTPYVHPVFRPVLSDGPDDSEFVLGLGVDIKFSPRFDVRVAGALGDGEGVSIGLAFIR